MSLEKLTTFGLTTVAVVGVAFAAQADTSENTLFVCNGTLKYDHGYYEITEELDGPDDGYPMDCYIDDKVVRQILKVCRVGKSCIVSAKGESGNRNGHVIQKVFEVQRNPQLDEAMTLPQRRSSRAASRCDQAPNKPGKEARTKMTHPNEILARSLGDETLRAAPQPSQPVKRRKISKTLLVIGAVAAFVVVSHIANIALPENSNDEGGSVSGHNI